MSGGLSVRPSSKKIQHDIVDIVQWRTMLYDIAKLILSKVKVNSKTIQQKLGLTRK